MQYDLSEFLTLATVHFFAVASPGPDFAVVFRQSISYGRTPALWVSLGIGAGIFVHVAYCLLGIGIIISQSLVLFHLLKLCGAGYLVWIGTKAIRSRPSNHTTPQVLQAPVPNGRQSFRLGFVTNVLNPKATIFFLAVFSVVVSPQTSNRAKIFYGIWMAVVSAAWFCILSLLFSHPAVRNMFARFGHWFERCMGVILIGLGLRLAFSRST